jgi:hypothetical protein
MPIDFAPQPFNSPTTKTKSPRSNLILRSQENGRSLASLEETGFVFFLDDAVSDKK